MTDTSALGCFTLDSGESLECQFFAVHGTHFCAHRIVSFVSFELFLTASYLFTRRERLYDDLISPTTIKDILVFLLSSLRRTAGYTRTDYKTNTQIAKELKITPILDKLLEYKRNWIQHVNRMPRNRLPRVMKHYSPTGRMNHGRPLKRLLEK